MGIVIPGINSFVMVIVMTVMTVLFVMHWLEQALWMMKVIMSHVMNEAMSMLCLNVMIVRPFVMTFWSPVMLSQIVTVAGMIIVVFWRVIVMEWLVMNRGVMNWLVVNWLGMNWCMVDWLMMNWIVMCS